MIIRTWLSTHTERLIVAIKENSILTAYIHISRSLDLMNKLDTFGDITKRLQLKHGVRGKSMSFQVLLPRYY
jgi:hypothetical protein